MSDNVTSCIIMLIRTCKTTKTDFQFLGFYFMQGSQVLHLPPTYYFNYLLLLLLHLFITSSLHYSTTYYYIHSQVY